MRAMVIAANWKLNKTLRESIDFVTLLKRESPPDMTCQVVICPPFTALAEVSEVLIDSNLKLGAQDLYWEDAGAFTGEVSAPLLKDAGCEYVIIGHSERRQFFHETNDAVNRKIKAALKGALTPIVCCGETLKEREAGKTLDILKEQLQAAYAGLDEKEALRTVIAYEPVWAIGTGKVATPAQAQEAQKFIRALLTDLFSKEVSGGLPILYGGSVKPDNSSEILKQPDVDGALVGGASLDAKAFVAIIRSASEAVRVA